VDVPMLCGHDLAVRQPNPRGVAMCVRVLLLYNTDRAQREIRHAYLRGAEAIKQDLDAMRSSIEAGVGGMGR
jgi:chorismate mutase